MSNWSTKFSAIQFSQNNITKSISPKLKCHWNKSVRIVPHFLFFFSFFFSFFNHIFWFFFSLFFSNFFKSHSLGMYIFSVFNLFSYFFYSQVNCSLCLLHFCLPSTSVLVPSNFISPSLVISFINWCTHFNLPQPSVARNQTKIHVFPFFFNCWPPSNGLSHIFSTAYEYPSFWSSFFLSPLKYRVFFSKPPKPLSTQPTTFLPQNNSKSSPWIFEHMQLDQQNSAHILNI